MPSCVVSGCKSQSHDANDVQYFSFPLRDSQRCKAWIKAIGKEGWEPTRWTKICSLHFTPNDYLTRPGVNRKILNTSAVPSVFMQAASHVVTKQSLDKESDKDHRHTVDTIQIKELPNKEETNIAPKKHKCYIFITVDCARRKTQSQNELQESSASTESGTPKRKKHSTLKEAKQLTQEVERLEKMILHQQTKIQKFQKILKVLKMRGLY